MIAANENVKFLTNSGSGRVANYPMMRWEAGAGICWHSGFQVELYLIYVSIS